MRKPSRAGRGKPSKARSRRPSKPKRNIESEVAAPRSAATQQVAEWLENLGMSEYAECFAENDVDLSVLPHLTDHDLKELGVSLGHRRKMLAAIAELAGAVHAPSQPTQTESKPQNTAERRHATLHVRRAKNGKPAAHPIRGDELRALRELHRQYPDSGYVFTTERGGPFTPDAVNRLIKRIGERAGFPFTVHAHMLRHACDYGRRNPRRHRPSAFLWAVGSHTAAANQRGNNRLPQAPAAAGRAPTTSAPASWCSGQQAARRSRSRRHTTAGRQPTDQADRLALPTPAS
jgi:hypothetical protein